tara:strand:+ start:534 stop:668 length:135 start_codon:yes stop_codon:yes gene_type:complete
MSIIQFIAIIIVAAGLMIPVMLQILEKRKKIAEKKYGKNWRKYV